MLIISQRVSNIIKFSTPPPPKCPSRQTTDHHENMTLESKKQLSKIKKRLTKINGRNFHISHCNQLRFSSRNIKVDDLLVTGNASSPGVELSHTRTQWVNMLGSTLLAYLWCAISFPVVWIRRRAALQSVCRCNGKHLHTFNRGNI